MDLPVELQMMIYKDLNLTELVQLAKTHPYNRAVVELSFKDKYSKFPFHMLHNYKLSIKIKSIENIEEEVDFETMLDAIRLFGHLMRTFDVFYAAFQYHEKMFQRLNEHISKYLSESLTEITLGYLHDKHLVGLEGPFKKVENVSFGFGTLESNNTNFSAMFPVVKRLDISHMRNMSSKTLEHHYPRLNFLKFGFWSEDYSDNSIQLLGRILRLNPQIRHLSLLYANMNSMDVVNKNAPNLEHLSINKFEAFYPSLYHRNVENVYFNNLKTLTVQSTHLLAAQSVPHDAAQRVPIVLGNLEEFSCEWSIELWFDIIVQNKQLKKLKMGYSDEVDIEQIIDQFQDLEEFTIDFTKSMNMHTDNFIKIIQKFIEQLKKLKKLSFSGMERNTSNALINLLAPEWMATTERNELIFRRECD